MAYSFKTKENLSKGTTEYNRYYGSFRGVDFSNDHTQVNSSRLAYAVNMYKDYRSKQGVALETVAGFRKRCYFAKKPTIDANGKATGLFTETSEKEIYGIIYFQHKSDDTVKTSVLVHSGKRLYLWRIGVYDGQYKEYHYSSILPTEFKDIKITHEDIEYDIELAQAVYYSDTDETKDLRGTVANSADDSGNESRQVYSQFVTANFNGMEIQVNIFYTIHEVVDIFTNTVKERHLYLCEEYGNYTGGVFKKATTLSSIDDNLFFGCVNGVVCSFNFDQRNDDGELPPKTYNFDERTIFSGCATLMDNCQIPHLTKTTIKRSTVIKTKSFRNSAAKIKVRTNKTPYKQIARINSALFSFEDMDFSDFSFNTTEQSLFAVKEKEKQWVEKQYFIYSDEYLKPFALYYVSFRYRVAGRYKE